MSTQEGKVLTNIELTQCQPKNIKGIRKWVFDNRRNNWFSWKSSMSANTNKWKLDVALSDSY